jgi:hypothetical protein
MVISLKAHYSKDDDYLKVRSRESSQTSSNVSRSQKANAA